MNAYSVSGIVLYTKISVLHVWRVTFPSSSSPFRTVRSQRHLSERFGERHILYGEVTGRLLYKQTRSFPNREIICSHFAYSREKSNFVSAFGYPPPTLDSPRLSIKVGYYALSNISCCEIRGPHGADKKLYYLPVISLDWEGADDKSRYWKSGRKWKMDIMYQPSC